MKCRERSEGKKTKHEADEQESKAGKERKMCSDLDPTMPEANPWTFQLHELINSLFYLH